MQFTHLELTNKQITPPVCRFEKKSYLLLISPLNNVSEGYTNYVNFLFDRSTRPRSVEAPSDISSACCCCC